MDPQRIVQRAVRGLVLPAVLNVIGGAASAQEPGFAADRYVRGLDQPTALAFDPEGRLFIAEKSGKVKIAIRGEVRTAPVIDLSPYTFFESGLIGIAIDPNYLETPYLYVFATVTPDEQQIIRYRIVQGTGVEPTVIRAHLPTGGTIHNGGCLRFGPDGMLYFSVGDNGTSSNAQDDTTLAGKICRIRPTGETPDDNPFVTATGARSAMYARGFRNPFRFCFDAEGRLFATDVGSFGAPRREEINLVRAGGNYGWPEVEGAAGDTPDDGYEPPIFDYGEEQGLCATGIVSYDGTQYPSSHHGDLFQLDYTLSKVFRVRLSGDQVVSHSLFFQAEGSTVDLIQGPDGRLYYCEYTTGEVKRITYVENAAEEPGSEIAAGHWGGDAEGEPDEDGDDDHSNGNNGDVAGGLIDGGLCGWGAPAGLLVLGLMMMTGCAWRGMGR